MPRSERDEVRPPGGQNSRPSYGQILRSTVFTGGASVVTLALGVVRTKVLALLLGPAGVGLAGMYFAVTQVASTLFGMGLATSGVRQMAEALGDGEAERVTRSARAVRRASWVLGGVGALVLALLAGPVSHFTFGDTEHAWAVAGLGFAVLLGTLANGETAVIQGLRRIRELAGLNVLAAVGVTLLGLPLVYALRERGLVALLVLAPGMTWLLALRFRGELGLQEVAVSWRESAREAGVLLKLGAAFMVSALFAAAAAYVIRVQVLGAAGLEGAGQYTAAYTLSGIYAGFILQSMGADYYPRLSAVAREVREVNRLVNEQTEVSLLLAIPGVLATLVGAPWVIHAFYAGGFDEAAGVLQWQVLGVFGRVLSWPLGFVLMARGRAGTFAASEFLAHAGHVALVAWALPRWGLAGAGVAFFLLYAGYTALVLGLVRRETGFRWSSSNLELLAWMVPLIAGTFLAREVLPAPWGVGVGLLATAAAGVQAFRGIHRRMPGGAARLRAWMAGGLGRRASSRA